MISQLISRAQQFYDELGDNDTRPRFISNTPYNDILHRGSLNSKSYCFDVLSYNWASQYYIVRFKGPEGVAISRIDFCKAWALSRRTVAFLGGLKSSIQDWVLEQEHAQDLETISELLRKYEAYWDELSFVMQHISSWERIGYLPFTHAHPFPPNYKSLVNNPCKPPSRRWILKGMDHSAPLDPYVRCESPFSALYIFYVKKILELHEEGFEDRWFAMWDKWGPDPVEYKLYRFPREPPSVRVNCSCGRRVKVWNLGSYYRNVVIYHELRFGATISDLDTRIVVYDCRSGDSHFHHVILNSAYPKSAPLSSSTALSISGSTTFSFGSLRIHLYLCQSRDAYSTRLY